MSELDIQVNYVRGRQQRLLEVMQEQRLDLVLVNRTEHVQYLTGPRFGWMFEVAAALFADGHCILLAPSRRPPEVHAADELVLFDAQWTSTVRNDQRAAGSPLLLEAIQKHGSPARVGVEFGAAAPHFTQVLSAEYVDIEPELFRLRRKKDPDELARIKKAIQGTRRMYETARRIIEPGVNELHVFNELQAAAVREFGEMLTGTGNDYRSGEKGGPPRDRKAQDGELYILDLGPAFRGYFSDNARTIAVGGKPTDQQQEAWEEIMKVFAHIEGTVQPGKSCRELYGEVKEMLDAYLPDSFTHHLGHGIGLFPHEGPHLNPNPGWDDRFEVGDVFTAEPGLYSDELNAGMRLENDYLVTESGIELLTDFPLELA